MAHRIPFKHGAAAVGIGNLGVLVAGVDPGPWVFDLSVDLPGMRPKPGFPAIFYSGPLSSLVTEVESVTDGSLFSSNDDDVLWGVSSSFLVKIRSKSVTVKSVQSIQVQS